MARNDENEHTFGSTSWEWRQVRMSRAPQATGTARAERARRQTLPRRDPREPLTVTVRYRGGPECWWELRARGAVWRVPGYVSVHDLMARINVMGGQ